MTRGTSNGNVSGNSYDRARRRAWLVATYRADVDVYSEMDPRESSAEPLGEGIPACRCYRCGALLTERTVTADRIIPGCEGGTYKRSNIRPACLPCNQKTGSALGVTRKRSAS